jgi:hypothetical protein
MACIEDVLHMVIQALSQNSFLNSFLEQVNSLGGGYVFVNLLQRLVASAKYTVLILHYYRSEV